MTEKVTDQYPVVQHRHESGEVVTLRLKRQEGGVLAVECEGCATRWTYKKPKAGRPIAGVDGGPRSHF